MFCTTVIPSIGRPTLSRAVESVLNQQFTEADIEVVVVNDSGRSLPQANWNRSRVVQVIETNRRNRSVARNAGAAIAKGCYLHFLDDDDWMLPGAFQSLWDLTQETEAAWLYGAFRLVDNSGTAITEIYPTETGNCLLRLLAWEWLPLQASLIASEAFFEVGGFAPLQALLGGFEDVDLSRQIALRYEMAGSDTVVTCIRTGPEGSSTDYDHVVEQNRQSREKTFDQPGSFRRLAASARTSSSRTSYWYGKLVYYYLASTKWQLRRKQLLTALERGFCAVASFLLGSWHLFSADFWRGVLRPYYPRVRVALFETGDDIPLRYSEMKRKKEDPNALGRGQV